MTATAGSPGSQPLMCEGPLFKHRHPAELPVEHPAKVELVLNLNAAKALGLTVPQVMVARAD